MDRVPGIEPAGHPKQSPPEWPSAISKWTKLQECGTTYYGIPDRKELVISDIHKGSKTEKGDSICMWVEWSEMSESISIYYSAGGLRTFQNWKIGEHNGLSIHCKYMEENWFIFYILKETKLFIAIFHKFQDIMKFLFLTTIAHMKLKIVYFSGYL